MEAAQSLYTADTSDPYIHPALRSLISSIIYRTAALYLFRENNSMARHSRRTIDITKRFRQLLRKNFIAIKRPSEYAGIMNISLSYLNDTVRMVTGFSVSYYIQQEVVREAQRLLCYTGLSIKEIASELNFEDEKYFNRVFSKVSGESPGLFRKKWDTGIADNADTRR